MVTFTINIPQMLAYIPYVDPMGISIINMGFPRFPLEMPVIFSMAPRWFAQENFDPSEHDLVMEVITSPGGFASRPTFKMTCQHIGFQKSGLARWWSLCSDWKLGVRSYTRCQGCWKVTWISLWGVLLKINVLERSCQQHQKGTSPSTITRIYIYIYTHIHICIRMHI